MRARRTSITHDRYAGTAHLDTAGLLYSKSPHWVQTEAGKVFLRESIESDINIVTLRKKITSCEKDNKDLKRNLGYLEVQNTQIREQIIDLKTKHEELKNAQTQQQQIDKDNVNVVQAQVNFLFTRDQIKSDDKIYGSRVIMSLRQLRAAASGGVKITADSAMGQNMIQRAVQQRNAWNSESKGNFEWTHQPALSPFTCLGLTDTQANFKTFTKQYMYTQEILINIYKLITADPKNNYLQGGGAFMSEGQKYDVEVMRNVEAILNTKTEKECSQMRDEFRSNTRARADARDSDRNEGEMFGQKILMSSARLKEIMAMNTIDADTAKEMADTAVKQANLWDGKIDWLNDFSHPQAYTVLGLTYQQGTARNQKNEYVYSRAILKQIFNQRLRMLHTDRSGDRDDTQQREFVILTFTNEQFIKPPSKDEAIRRRNQYTTRFATGWFKKDKSGMYNQAFTVSLFV